MVIPRGASEHRVYSEARRNLALPPTAVIPVEATIARSAEQSVGFHVAMPEVAELFERNEVCAIVAGVGPLVEPVSKEAYLARSVRLPPQLFSHNDQQDQWHSLKGDSDLRSGWGGRMADYLQRTQAVQTSLAINVSLSGQTLFQAGESAVPYTMSEVGPASFAGLGAEDASSLARRGAVERVLRSSSNPYERAFADVQLRALEKSEALERALKNVRSTGAPGADAGFPDSRLGRQLRTVTDLIAARNELQASRQIFFVSTTGFDTHDNQAREQPRLLADLSRSLAAFYRTTVAMGVSESVTTFTQSEFGRTLTSNGDGTDHGWAGIQLVVGGSVRGRQIIGRYPLLEIDGPDDVGGGRIIPTLSTDQYAATLAKWFGVPPSELTHIAPHLPHFSERDLGFLTG